MSDDVLDINFGDVDFSKVKKFPTPVEGAYEMVIDDYKMFPSKDDPTCTKGVNAKVVFKFADPYSVEAMDWTGSEDPDFTSFKAFDNIYILWENPFGSKPFYEAALGRDLSEESVTAEELKAVSNYIGEHVGAVLFHEPHWQDKKRVQVKINSLSYYAV
jgi:hypothetical protein